MARKLFERQAIRRRTGALASGVTMVVYSDAAATVLADISTSSGGSAIAGSIITSADIAGLGPAALRFYGPTDGTDTLYIRVPSDTSLGVQKIEASTDDRLDLLEVGGGAHPNLATHDALGLATDADLTTHGADTTAIHGITDTSQVALRNAANTFTADNLFRSGRPWVDVRAYGTNTAAIDSAWAAAVTAGAALYFPPGTDYTYGGTGLDASTITCIGAGRDLVTITLSAGVYLFKPSSALQQTLITGITTSGGKGLLHHTYTGASVGRHHTIKRCRFTAYTECAIASEAADMPYWRILDNVFDAANDDSTIGIALGSDSSSSAIYYNSFWRNRIDVKCRQAGLSTYIIGNDFIHFDSSPSAVRARIWFVPHTSTTNAGAGAVVSENKFGNENLDATDLNIVIADEGSGATNSVKMPALGADSTGYVLTHLYTGNKISGSGATGIPFVYSTTPNVRGCTIGPVLVDGTPPSYLLQFRTAPGPDYFNATNVIGPVVTPVMGTEAVATPASNAAFAGTIIDPSSQLDAMAGVGFHGTPGAGDLTGYANLLTTGIRGFSSGGFALTLNNVADAVGGADAAEVVFTAGAYLWAYTSVTPTVNKPAFLEFDLKLASTSPLASVEANVSYDSAGAIFVQRNAVPPAAGWARYRVPLKFATVAPTVIHVRFRSPAAGRIEIGRVRLYHASEPVNTDGWELAEQPADWAAPASNRVRIYAIDNGAGKTQLVARFPTGATQPLATEP